MAKNLMPEIIKMLGVEYGEKFKLRENGEEDFRDGVFCFVEDLGFRKLTLDDKAWSANDMLEELLTGYYEIVKLPWEPKYEEQFYTYIHNDAHNEWLIEWLYWYGTPTQLALKQLGMVFKTEEEAEKARPEIYKKLTGKDWK